MKSIKELREELEKGVVVKRGGETLILTDIGEVARPSAEQFEELNPYQKKKRNKRARDQYRQMLKSLTLKSVEEQMRKEGRLGTYSKFKVKKEYEKRKKEIYSAIRNTPKKMTLEERRQYMNNLSSEDKQKRGLLAQMYTLFRKSFPGSEKQSLKVFKWEYGQRLLPSRDLEKKEDYDLLALHDKDGKMKGFIGFSTSARGSKVALVGYIAIDPKERGKGFSKDLYQKAIEVAKSRGSKYMVAEIEAYGQREKGRHVELNTKKTLTEEEKAEKQDLDMKKTRILAQSRYYTKVKGMTYLQPPLGNATRALPIDLYISFLDGRKDKTINRGELLGIIKEMYKQNYNLSEGKLNELMYRTKRLMGKKARYELIAPKESIGK